MYLVELRPGKEELYRSVDELAIAIRSGAVDTHSRIFHRATSKWISITVHPQYKAIAAELGSAPASEAPRKNWTFLQSAEAGLEAEATPTDSAQGTAAGGRSGPWWRRSLGLGAAGLLLVLGVQLASRAPKPPWAGRGGRQVAARPATAATETATKPTPGTAAARPTPAGWSNVGYPLADDEPAPTRVARASARLPKAPRVKLKSLAAAPRPTPARGSEDEVRSAAELTERYRDAYDSAQARLEAGIRVARLDQLLAPARLTPSGGVRETRMGLAGVTNFVRAYRTREAAIERAYQDSFAVLSKRLGWTPEQSRAWTNKPSRRERPELAALTGSLLTGIDSVLGVLDAQAGAYRLTGDRIAFENPAAARTYGVLRRRVEGQLARAAAANAGGATRALLEAVGTSRLPREN